MTILDGARCDGLDNLVWRSLTGRHADLAEGGDLARRYAPDVNVFAATRDSSSKARAALGDIVPAGQTVFLVEPAPLHALPGFHVAPPRPAVRLVWAGGPSPSPDAAEVLTLGDADAPEMLALATLTAPGPFAARTHLMGRFIGLRAEGRLVAMAGERLQPPGYCEVSGVCTRPDMRGRGLARRLTALVTAAILARGDTPFLHAWTENHGAIALYEALGFQRAASLYVAVITREGAAAT